MLHLHYHTELIYFEGNYYAPHYYVAWVNGLSKFESSLCLIAYVRQENNRKSIANLEKIFSTIKIISIGKKPLSFVKQVRKWWSVYKKIKNNIKESDSLLIRMPTIQFLPIIKAFRNQEAEINVMLVGNILKARQYQKRSVKNILIQIFWSFENSFLRNIVRKKIVKNLLSNGVAPAIDYRLQEEARNFFTSTVWCDSINEPKSMTPSQIKCTQKGKIKLVMITRDSDEKFTQSFLDQIVSQLDVELHIIGVDGPTSASIKFHGYLEQKQFVKILQECDIGLVLSEIDWQPRVVWEFAAFGLPIIINRNVRGQYWSFAHKTNAIQIIEENSVTQILDAINRINETPRKVMQEEILNIAKRHTVERSSEVIYRLIT